MYKNILVALIIAFFAGCSAPKPEQTQIQIPSWYTKPPKDTINFYAVASAKNMEKARKQATISLRNNINNELDATFKTPNNQLSPNAQRLKEIQSVNLHICNTILLRHMELVNSKVFNGQTLILISTPRKDAFVKVLPSLNEKIESLENIYTSNKNLTSLKRYTHIKPLMTQYTYLASVTASKQISFSSYSPNNNYRILKELNDEYEMLQSTINFYIISDGNSRIYVRGVKEALKKDGMKISNNMQNSDTLKLIINSKSTESEKYTFMVSNNLVRFITIDANKNEVSYRQHTLVGKSRKSYKDAKQQTATHLNVKIKKLGIFNTIGIKNN